MKDAMGRFLTQWRTRTVLPHIKGRLLDIGCGTNNLVRSYHDDGIGIDVHQWGDVDILVDESATLPFQDQAFDTVTIIASLNHIPNRLEVLRESNRVLKNGGAVIITMIPPKLSKVWHLLRKPWDADQKERGMKNGEVYGITDRDLHLLIAKSGFQIVLKKRFMFMINCLTIACKIRKDCSTPTYIGI
jgi:SAM-dependent methyltransferase